MTIIAAHNRTMVADTTDWRGGTYTPVTAPKIVRAPDGSLVGSAGTQPDLQTLRDWVRAGMDWTKTPAFIYDKDDADDSVDSLWLKPDGMLWRFSSAAMKPYPLHNPNTVGVHDACLFVDGAIAAGADVVRAVQLAVERCAYVGGPLQVEHLDPVAITNRDLGDENTPKPRTWECHRCNHINLGSLTCVACGYGL